MSRRRGRRRDRDGPAARGAATGSTPAGSRCAARAWAASSRSTQRRPRPGDRRRDRDLPRRRGPPGSRASASGRSRCASAIRVDLEAWLLAQDVGEAVERIAGRPLILMHAEGDTQIPSDHSEELYERAGEPRKLIIAPGGAHTTVQHDPELQGDGAALARARARAREPGASATGRSLVAAPAALATPGPRLDLRCAMGGLSLDAGARVTGPCRGSCHASRRGVRGGHRTARQPRRRRCRTCARRAVAVPSPCPCRLPWSSRR